MLHTHELTNIVPKGHCRGSDILLIIGKDKPCPLSSCTYIGLWEHHHAAQVLKDENGIPITGLYYCECGRDKDRETAYYISSKRIYALCDRCKNRQCSR